MIFKSGGIATHGALKLAADYKLGLSYFHKLVGIVIVYKKGLMNITHFYTAAFHEFCYAVDVIKLVDLTLLRYNLGTKLRIHDRHLAIGATVFAKSNFFWLRIAAHHKNKAQYSHSY